MAGEDFDWPIPVADNDYCLIHCSQGAARTPPDAAIADVTAISHQGVIDFYVTIYQFYITQTNNLRPFRNHVLSIQVQLINVISVRDDAWAELWSLHC
jgi:hypothetical protein